MYRRHFRYGAVPGRVLRHRQGERLRIDVDNALNGRERRRPHRFA